MAKTAYNDQTRPMVRFMKKLLILCMTCDLFTALAHTQQRNYAVIVGIAGYPNFAEADRLKYADIDAKRFYDFIVSPQGGGFPSSNVHMIRNGEATHDRIAKEIEWMGQHSPIDRAYIFFAGHGVTDGRGLAYFMPWDGDPVFPSAAGFRTDRFLEDVKDEITAETLVVFIDACHAASAFSSGRRGPENIATTILENWHSEFKSPQQEEVRMAFLAAASNESALEDDEFRGGLFTYYLIMGLEGEADADKNRKVTALELRNYLDDKVAQRALRKFKARQDPTLSPGFFPDLTLSILGDTNGASWKPDLRKPSIQNPPPNPSQPLPTLKPTPPSIQDASTPSQTAVSTPDSEEKRHAEELERCYAVALSSCMSDCIYKFNNSEKTCRQKLCSRETNLAYWNRICTRDLDRGKHY